MAHEGTHQCPEMVGKVVEDQVYNKSKPSPTIRIRYNFKLPNTPGFSLVQVQVSFPPGGASAPHRHGAASVSATILSGTAYNKMNEQPTYLLQAGDSFFEAPGCHHVTGANASDTEPMELLANFVVESKVVDEQGLADLVIVDEEWR